MLVSLSFCPAPPVLVPALAAGAAGELDGLRQACREAVARLLGAGPDRLVVLGPGPVTRAYGPGSAGTLAGFGVPVVAALGAPVGPAVLPPALTLGAWLLDGAAPDGAAPDGAGPDGAAPDGAAPDDAAPDGAGPVGAPPDDAALDDAGPDGTPPDGTGPVGAAPLDAGPDGGAPVGGLDAGPPVGAAREGVPVAGLVGVPVTGLAVGPGADPAAVAAGLAGPDRLGLLVMGDGSARRSERAPGYVDPRAAGFDAAVAAALATGDAAALRDLDPARGAELLAGGVPAWRVAGHAAAGVEFDAELLRDEAPYGVGYLVAAWTAR
ncbi:MAG TPA: hypothetical protein VE547_18515 [Mycobacteriales bacterium]|nr:hypothetical protein [Mycobacteriales bacterium]